MATDKKDKGDKRTKKDKKRARDAAHDAGAERASSSKRKRRKVVSAPGDQRDRVVVAYAQGYLKKRTTPIAGVPTGARHQLLHWVDLQVRALAHMQAFLTCMLSLLPPVSRLPS